MDRRNFFKTAAMAAAAGIAGARENAFAGPETKPSEGIRVYNRLGKTDLKMSDISFGAGPLSNPTLVHKALDMGINYFDTSPDYGVSETTLGKVFKNKSKREKALIATKMCKDSFAGNHIKPGTPAKDIVKSVKGSLKRLNTDYIDVLLLHSLGDQNPDYNARLKDEELAKALAYMKESGMVRCTGVSSHGPKEMEAGLKAAVETGLFDMIMPAFNHLQYERLLAVLEFAGKKGVGVVAMKTLAGGRAMDLSKYEEAGGSYPHACFKWVLSHPQVAGLIVTMDSMDKISHYARASGKKLGRMDEEILRRYADLHEKDYCRTGCGDCAGACPHGAAIPDVLRFGMYFTDYGRERYAMERYAGLPSSARADACAGCSAPCEGACPYGLNVKSKLLEARDNLTFRIG